MYEVYCTHVRGGYMYVESIRSYEEEDTCMKYNVHMYEEEDTCVRVCISVCLCIRYVGDADRCEKKKIFVYCVYVRQICRESSQMRI